MKHAFIYRHYQVLQKQVVLFVLLLNSKHIAYCLQYIYNIFANSSCHCILCKLQLSFRFLLTQQHCLKDSVRKKKLYSCFKKSNFIYQIYMFFTSYQRTPFQLLDPSTRKKITCNEMQLSVRNLITIYFPHLQFVSVLQ